MQRQAFFAQADLAQQIKTYFYNKLVEYVLAGEAYDRETIQDRVEVAILNLLQTVLVHSRGKEGIALPGYPVSVTDRNCPPLYADLFDLLMQVKHNYSAATVNNAMELIMQLDSFREINPTQALLEMAGIEESIRAEDIRETFYQEMLAQALLAVQKGLLTKEDFEDQDAAIYLILPALTVLQAVRLSQASNGIRLLNNKSVTLANCPQEEGFPDLIRSLLVIKDNYLRLSDERLDEVREVLVREKQENQDEEKVVSPEVTALAAMINSLATRLSQRRVFQDTVTHVVDRVCEVYQPEAVPALKA